MPAFASVFRKVVLVRGQASEYSVAAGGGGLILHGRLFEDARNDGFGPRSESVWISIATQRSTKRRVFIQKLVCKEDDSKPDEPLRGRARGFSPSTMKTPGLSQE